MPKKYIPKTTQKALEKLAKGCCEYCKALQMYFAPRFTNEHIIPSILNGSDKLENLAKACFACNLSKGMVIKALDSTTNQTVRLFHPRKDKWEDHFKWNDDFLTVIGLTPIGRATISRLKMNRQESINIRRVTLGNGHPPD